MEAILSGTITLEQRQQQPLAAALQQRQLLEPPSPPPPPQEQPLHDLLRDGYTISRRLCADIHHHRHCHPRDPPSFFLLQLHRPLPSCPTRDQPRAGAPPPSSSVNRDALLRAEVSPANRRSCWQRARACRICRATRLSPLYGRFVTCSGVDVKRTHLPVAAGAPLRRVHCGYSALLRQPTFRYIYCLQVPCTTSAARRLLCASPATAAWRRA